MRLAPVRDFAEAIGADDVITPKEYSFLRQKVTDLIALQDGETVDTLARAAIRIFAPQAKPEALVTLAPRIAKLKPSIEAMCVDGVITLQELDFLKKKIAELQLIKGSETPEQLARNPTAVKIKAQVQQSLSEHAKRETRGKLGAPWVRGWSDSGLPSSGNQQ